MKPFTLALCLAAAGCATAPPGSRPVENRVPIQLNWTPNPDEITKGVKADGRSCAQIENAVWAVTGPKSGECIRFWGSIGTSADWSRSVVFFHGDVWNGTAVDPTYLQTTEKRLQETAHEWAKRLGTPYIFVGRPGAFGSSGDHMQRRRKDESVILSAAMDALKKRFGILEYSIAGQSGGGHVVASLLANRSDIVCAVPASAVSSPYARWVIRGWAQDSTGYADSHEPAQSLVKEGKHPSLRLFVVGSPEDRNTPWASQLLLSGRAKSLGIPTLELKGVGAGSQSHGMSNSARLIAGWCANGLTNDQILDQAKSGLNG